MNITNQKNKKTEDFFNKNNINKAMFKKTKKSSKHSTKKRKLIIIILVLFIFLFLGGGFFLYKAGNILNKISEGNSSAFGSVFGALPGIGSRQQIETDDQGRTNVLLLGMRGEDMPGGGLLADTIMVATLKLDETEGSTDDKVGLISIPRDLYVNIPGTSQHSKINAVYYYGEEQQNTTGINEMKEIISTITGLDIHYAATINFKGFEELIDAVGGVDVELNEPFEEPVQFHEAKVCDGDVGGVFTIKTGEYEYKKDERGKIVASYPLCYNPNEECGGIFRLPAGKQTLNGETALCYVRSRVTSSDFDRAKRQQLILKKLKDKLISLDTFTDFSKMNNILNAVGDNVKTDMSSTEMRKFFEKYSRLQNSEIYQKVLESSDEGLLISPTNYPKEVGYILIPSAGQDNYGDIQNMAQNIFILPKQTDINQ